MDIILNYYYLSAILMLLASFIPLIIYLMYGREPKIQYNANYEVELPTDDPPAVVNAIYDGLSKEVGEPDINGFKATIMDLIDRNYLILTNKTSNGDYCSPGSLFLEINPEYDTDALWKFEEEILHFLREYEQDGIISMDLVSESLHYYNSARFFKYTYNNWQKEVEKAVMEGNFKDTFHSKGDEYLKIFGLLGMVLALSAFFYALDPTRNAYSVLISSIILGVMALISIILPQKVAGQWTTYGREYYARWHNFKKYIEDYSLIKEYSPESVKVWNRYLVYATALGVAEGVKRAMELSIPDDKLIENDIYSFDCYNDYISSLNDAEDTKPDSDKF